MAESLKVDHIRMLVEIACKHGAPVDVVFENDGDIRVNIYPPDLIPDCSNPAGKRDTPE